MIWVVRVLMLQFGFDLCLILIMIELEVGGMSCLMLVLP